MSKIDAVRDNLRDTVALSAQKYGYRNEREYRAVALVEAAGVARDSGLPVSYDMETSGLIKSASEERWKVYHRD